MEEIVKEYVFKIQYFEKLIKTKYNLKLNPCLIKDFSFEKKGIIQNFEYRFHGNGCTFKEDNVVYAYDISIFVANEIEFTLWEFSEFLRTHHKYKLYNFNSEYIEKELEKLINDGILSWLVIAGRIYKTYRVLIS